MPHSVLASVLPCAELARGPDPQALERIERWYQEQCRPVSEICIVPVPLGPSASAHLHAVVVPDFALLREHRQPNSRELIRFEFQEVSKLLAPAERPHTFAVRARPLPRTANGKLDRERLRIELSQPVESPGVAPPAEDESAGGRIYRLIRASRPTVSFHDDSNLELHLGFDSLDRIVLICSVEKTLGIAIPPEQAARIFTVGELIDTAVACMPQPARSSARAPSLASSFASWAELLSRPLDPDERTLADSILKTRPVCSFLAWGAARVLRVFGADRFRFQVHGHEWLPSSGAYLLIANHCSHLDPLFLLWSLPFRVARQVSFMGHTEYFGSGWKAALARRLKLVPVDPDQHALEGIKLCAEALRRGLIGAVFPEGERSPNGAQQRFHRGIAMLAMRMRIPMVPVAIAGTYEVLPRGGKQLQYAPVKVSFAAPLRAEEGESEQDLLARLWAAVWRLRGADARSREPIPRLVDCRRDFVTTDSARRI